MKTAIDHTGKTYGKLTGIKHVGYHNTSGGNKKRLWLWKCDCGKEKVILAEHVSRRHVKSCGCLLGAYSGVTAIANQVFCECYKDGDLSFEEFLLLSQQDCWYCGKEPSNHRKGRSNVNELVFSYNGLDRLDSSLPHDRDNLVPCCWQCNELKGNSHVGDFLNWVSRVYKMRCDA